VLCEGEGPLNFSLAIFVSISYCIILYLHNYIKQVTLRTKIYVNHCSTFICVFLLTVTIHKNETETL